MRHEATAEALALDRQLRAVWSRHRNFTLVPHQGSFLHKLVLGLAAMTTIVAALGVRATS